MDPFGRIRQARRKLVQAGEARDAGDLASAERLLREAIDELRDLGGARSIDFAVALANLGQVLAERDDPSEGSSRMEDAIRVLRDVPSTPQSDEIRGQVLSSFGALRLAMGYRDELGCSVLEEALALQTGVLGEASEATALTRIHLAKALSAMGPERAARGETLLAEAVDALRSAGPEHAAIVSKALHEAGLAAVSRGDLAGAERHFRASVEAARAGSARDRATVSPTLFELAQVCAATARDGEALALLEDAVAEQDLAIAQGLGMSEDRQIEALQEVRYGLDAYVALVAERFGHDQGAVVRAYGAVLRRKGIAAAALAAQRRPALDPGGVAAQLVSELLRVRAEHGRQLAIEHGAGGGKAPARGELQALAARREALERAIEQIVTAEGAAPLVARVSPEEVVSALPADSALVEWLRVKPLRQLGAPAAAPPAPSHRYVAFVARAGAQGRIAVFDLGDAGEIEAAVDAARRSITGEESAPTRHARVVETDAAERARASSAPLWSLFDLLMAPVLGAVGDAPLLLLAPDSALWRLPLGVVSARDADPLIETRWLGHVTSGRDLVRPAGPRDVEAGPPVVIAAPDFDLGAPATGESYTGRFRSLSGAMEEGREIGRLLGVEPIEGPLATERRMKEQRSPRILHVATHGFHIDRGWILRGLERWGRSTPPGQPPAGNAAAVSDLWMLTPELRSGLALSGANNFPAGTGAPEDSEDGILTALDAAMLDLRGTELVVLSACETALGDVVDGEGLRGLARAFLQAGARTVVVGAWKIPDTETALLMIDFYRWLLGGAGRAEALARSARAARARSPHVAFWGAFMCIGDPGPILGLGPPGTGTPMAPG